MGNLQVVENSPADQKPIEVQATEPIAPAAKTKKRAQKPIDIQRQEPIAQAAKNTPGAKVAAQRQKSIELLQQKNLTELEEIGWRVNVLPEGDLHCRQSWIDALLINVNPFALQYLCRRSEIMQEAFPAGEIQRIELIAQAVENTPGVEVDPA